MFTELHLNQSSDVIIRILRLFRGFQDASDHGHRFFDLVVFENALVSEHVEEPDQISLGRDVSCCGRIVRELLWLACG